VISCLGGGLRSQSALILSLYFKHFFCWRTLSAALAARNSLLSVDYKPLHKHDILSHGLLSLLLSFPFTHTHAHIGSQRTVDCLSVSQRTCMYNTLLCT